MKMRRMLGFVMAAGLAGGVYAHTITCNLVDDGTGYVTTDHIDYTLTVDGTANVDLVGVAYFSAVAPKAGTMYIKDSGGNAVAGWIASDGNDFGFTVHDTYVQNGQTVVGYDLFNTGLNVFWENVSGANLGVGTYTIGWDVDAGTYAYGEVAMYVLGDDFSNDDWDSPVNSGQAPVHGLLEVVPEPTSMALLGLSVVALALRRRRA